MTDTFDFRVKRSPSGLGWKVTLPHQCDDWLISGEQDELPAEYEWEYVTHEHAIKMLERFIAEAQLALVALREKREKPSRYEQSSGGESVVDR